MNISSAGEVTKPLQPAFLVLKNALQTNIATGSWTTVVFTGAAGSVVFDQGSDFSGNTFTAPVTGRYLFSFALNLEDIDIDSTYIAVRVATSNRGFMLVNIEPDQLGAADFNQSVNGSVFCDMDASDTATLDIYINGGAAQVDIQTSATSWFSGSLIC